jgi:hypothetical protein
MLVSSARGVVVKHVFSERPRIGRTVAAGTASMLAGLFAATAHGDPLPTRNENPLLAPYGLPNTLPSRLPADGSGSIAAVLNWANIHLLDDGGTRSFTLDGESQEWRLEIEHGVTDKFAVRVELPWRYLSGGSLDSVVEQWHSLWHLPNGHRNNAPRDRLLIDYTENDLTLLHVDESSSGIGDIPVSLGYQAVATDQHALAAWLTVKIPTGSAQDLTGSEAVDVALSLAGQTQLAERWQVFGQADVVWLSSGDLLPAMQQDYAWSALAGVTWNAWRGLDLTVQLDANSKVFDSSGTHLEGDAAVLNFGGSYRTTGGWRFDLGFGEELRSDAAPDFTLNLGVRHGY